jgi:hypothetical protein
MIKNVLLALGGLLMVVTTASAQEQPCVFPSRAQVNASVRAIVTKDASGFNYSYSLENRPPSQQILIWFAVQAFTSGGLQAHQIGPSEWDATGPIANTSYYMWDMLRGPRGLAVGASAVGLGFSQADLPAIVTFLAWGEVETPKFPEGEAPEGCQNTDIIENSFKGKTVGPKPPVQPFVAIEFLNYLITLLHDSRRLGWIKVDGVHQSLLGKLITAKRKLEAGDTLVAKDNLNAFLNEVRAVSCLEFSCPGNKPETSEAYALLYFNGQYLWERIP